MVDTLVRSAGYVWEFTKFLGDRLLGFFAPGQWGFLLLLFTVVVFAGKYGSRVLKKRHFFRMAALCRRTAQCCGVLIAGFAAYQLVQTVYPLLVKAVSAIR